MLSFPVSADQNSRRPALQNPSRKVCASNPSLFKRFRTLARNGALATPLQSIVSALFPMQRRGYPFISTHTRPPSTFYKFFRITTCKSGSKQTTLSTFKINTYEKTGGEGGGSFFFLTSLLLYFLASFFAAHSAFTAAPMIPISSDVGITSNRLPCSGLIFTIS